MAFGIGIDVGGTKIYAAVAEEKNVIKVLEAAVPDNLNDFTTILEGMTRKLTKLVPQVEAIGVGIPGAVNLDGKCWIPNLAYLTGLDLRNHLETGLGIPVMVANDGQLALLGEVWCGAASGLQNAVLVAIGTGIGGGVLMDGKIRVGANGTAGSMGWIVQRSEYLECAHYETRASGTALNQLARAHGMDSSYQLFQEVKRGNEAAMRPFLAWLKELGAGIASIVSLFDPEVVLISGGLSREDELILPALRDWVSQLASPRTRETPIKVAHHRDKATLYGAIRMAIMRSLC